MDDILTLEELAAYLKVSETTAYTLVRSGHIPGRKVGREWRFLRESVVQWLKQASTEQAGTEEDMEKTGFVARDELGGEYKQENGQEYVALWLPITREEKAKQIEKAQREGVNVSDLVVEYLRNWAKA